MSALMLGWRWIAVIAALVSSFASAPARADDAVWPQVSYSMAVGASQRRVVAHLWAGAGLHAETGPLRGLFVLGGVAGDLRDGDSQPERSAHGRQAAGARPRAAASASELWLSVRAGAGMFEPRALAPKAAIYVIAGRRVGGPDGAPTTRLGMGASVPAAMPLAYFGIPTMIELGADGGGDLGGTRWFWRLGWNF